MTLTNSMATGTLTIQSKIRDKAGWTTSSLSLDPIWHVSFAWLWQCCQIGNYYAMDDSAFRHGAISSDADESISSGRFVQVNRLAGTITVVDCIRSLHLSMMIRHQREAVQHCKLASASLDSTAAPQHFETDSKDVTSRDSCCCWSKAGVKFSTALMTAASSSNTQHCRNN